MSTEPLNKRKIVAIVIAAGFSLAVIYHAIQIFLGYGYPYDTFLFDPRDRFMDFYNNTIAFREFGWNTQIFAGQNILFWSLSGLSDPWALGVFFCFFALYFIWFMFRFALADSKYSLSALAQTSAIAFLSFPVMFVVDRANIEMFMFMLVSSFAIFYWRGRKHLASVFLAFAICSKLFPAVLGVFYVRDRAFRPLLTLFLSVAAIAATLLIPFDPEYTFERSAMNIGMYNDQYVIGDVGYAFGHSVFALLKYLVYLVADRAWFITHGPFILKIYTFLTFATYAAFALVLILNRAIPFWKQLAIMTLLFLLLPHVSADYRLLHLFAPLAFFFRDREASRYDFIYSILFGLIMIPKAYFQDPNGSSISILVNPILLVSLLTLIVVDEYQSGRLGFKDWRSPA